MNTSPAFNLIKDRAEMLARARSFFAALSILEVDCPALTQKSSIDEHIDVMTVHLTSGEKRYLHTSPEYGMKRLLAAGSGDIYQMSHVFREGECGGLHNPEFMMTEWYRIGMSLEPFIEETLDFIRLFLNTLPSQTLSYRDALKMHTGIDYLQADNHDLLQFLHKQEIIFASDPSHFDRDTLLQLILNTAVEPHLGQNILSVITDFPASQAALARVKQKGDEEVAERFEIYYKGIELANGYHELADAKEQKRRQMQANQKRMQSGKKELPIDDYLITALEKGFPDCCGVAVGFDRLMMLRHQKSSLAHILPFAWTNA